MLSNEKTRELYDQGGEEALKEGGNGGGSGEFIDCYVINGETKAAMILVFAMQLHVRDIWTSIFNYSYRNLYTCTLRNEVPV